MSRPPAEVLLRHAEQALQRYGDTPEGAHWPNDADRQRRFDVMLDLLADRGPGRTVLCDLGCGTGELYARLRARGMDDVAYIGVDRSGMALAHARRKFPGVAFIDLDVNDPAVDLAAIDCDYLVANGLFTARWESTHEQMRSFLEATVTRVWPRVRRALAFNVMSTAVDWERDDLFHLSMDELSKFLHRLAGRNLVFRADYGLYEYTAYVRRTSAIDPGVLQARRHRVYAQQQLKEQLLESLPRAAAFERYRCLLEWPAEVHLRELPLEGLHEAAAARGHALRETVAGGSAFEVAPPPVFGEGNHRVLRGRRRPRFLACLGPALVQSRSSVLVLDDRVAIDAEATERRELDDRVNLDPAVFDVEQDTAFVIEGAASPTLAIDEAFTLVGTHTWAFGHWLWESLPRYVGAGLDGLPPMPVLVDAGMPRQHRQALEMLIGEGDSIVELPTRSCIRVGRAWAAPTSMYMPQFERMNARFRWDVLAADPAAFAPLIAEMNRRIPELPSADVDGIGAGERLFLARRAGLHRKLVNRAEIESAAEALGFAIAYPEDMDFATQVARIRAARHIVGPEGSAFFLAFFARPGTRVDILNHPYTVGLPVLTGLLEAIGLRVRILTGPAMSANAELPHFIDYRIDPERFAAFLQDLLAP